MEQSFLNVGTWPVEQYVQARRVALRRFGRITYPYGGDCRRGHHYTAELVESCLGGRRKCPLDWRNIFVEQQKKDPLVSQAESKSVSAAAAKSIVTMLEYNDTMFFPHVFVQFSDATRCELKLEA